MSRYAESPDERHCPSCAIAMGYDCLNNCLPESHRLCPEHYEIGLAGAKGY